MARHPKSEQAHWLNGTLPHKTTKTASNFIAGRPSFPPHLSKPAKAEFKRCVGLMEARGTLTAGDYQTLAVFSVVVSRWIEAKRAIDLDGLMIEAQVLDSNGTAIITRRLHPLLRVAENCERQILALASKLGLTPADREKTLQAQPAPQLSALDRIVLGARSEDEDKGV